MGILSKINKVLKYKEPEQYKKFRFPEDEDKDRGEIDRVYVGAENKQEYSSQESENNSSEQKQKDQKDNNSNPDKKSNKQEGQDKKQNSDQDVDNSTGKTANDGTEQTKQTENENNKHQSSGKPKKRELKKPIEVKTIGEDKNPCELKEVSKKLQENMEKIKHEFNIPVNQDVVIREFKVMEQQDAFIVFMDGMVSKDIINDYILRQLMVGNRKKQEGKEDTRSTSNSEENKQEKENLTIDYIANNLLTINQITKEKEFEKIIQQVLNGLCALFVDGDDHCILVESRGYEVRSVTVPQTEAVVKGPHEAFIENLRTNLTLIRRIIRNKGLITEIMPIGKVDNVSCAIVYMKDIANPKVVDEVKRRIKSLDVEYVPGGGIMEQLIEDHPFSLLPQILSTERPDRTANMLMHGHVAIITDGTPSASIVPMTFYNMMHTTEDMSDRWPYGAFLRALRFVAIVIALIVPGLYAALSLYHQEMIPTELLMSLYRTRQNTPFPIFIEILLMELSFEIIREAGVRVPGVVGQTLGIIGAIVLGEAAVSAELVSPALIIVIAVTGLCGFVVPTHSLSFGIRISRFLFTIMGALAGFYGISLSIFAFGAYHASLKSFGVPIFSPVAPKTKSGYSEVIRGPIESSRERPDYLNPQNLIKLKTKKRGWDATEKGDGNS